MTSTSHGPLASVTVVNAVAERVGVGDVGRRGHRRADVGRGGGQPTGVARDERHARAARDGQARRSPGRSHSSPR